MIARLQDWTPQVDPTCYVAPNATIIGQVMLGTPSHGQDSLTVGREMDSLRDEIFQASPSVGT